jgi:hypothetical protein
MVRRLLWAAVLGIVLFVGIVVGRVIAPTPRGYRELTGVVGQEESRVTDPTGSFDAVVLYETYGPAGGGGINWYVCIVRKGRPAVSAKEAVFMSVSTKGERVRWRQPHLLEIEYDQAEILDFENLWSTNVLNDRLFSDPYWIELRLAPTSPDFSTHLLNF